MHIIAYHIVHLCEITCQAFDLCKSAICGPLCEMMCNVCAPVCHVCLCERLGAMHETRVCHVFIATSVWNHVTCMCICMSCMHLHEFMPCMLSGQADDL